MELWLSDGRKLGEMLDENPSFLGRLRRYGECT